MAKARGVSVADEAGFGFYSRVGLVQVLDLGYGNAADSAMMIRSMVCKSFASSFILSSA